MNNLVLYFIKSGIAMVLFYGIYRLFMEKETNYSLNRFYLAGTVIQTSFRGEICRLTMVVNDILLTFNLPSNAPLPGSGEFAQISFDPDEAIRILPR